MALPNGKPKILLANIIPFLLKPFILGKKLILHKAPYQEFIFF
jgi:hypothetical protein